jgi:myo-inositol 2-dehydrogenase/D-chiro-inositol 1-dehydrogenase
MSEQNSVSVPSPGPMAARPASSTSRRDFLKSSSLLVAGGAVAGSVAGPGLSVARGAHPYGSDAIKLGLIGCGGRGTGAAVQAMNTMGGEVKLVAMGDAFDDKVQAAYRGAKSQHGDKVDVPKDRMFSGLEAYKGVLATDVDMVILATPPGFRPLHYAAAVAAGKHVFMEKPVAVDAAGVRKCLEANKVAKEKNLAVAVGLQRRHEPRYKETIKRIQDGMIGDIILARAYWNGATPWVRQREDKMTEMEYQMRNWYYFNWLCGDHIVEQHIHNLDVINWIMNDYPVIAQGQGGCEVRKGKDYGETFDHHFVEFKYKTGAVMYSQCRHIPGCWNAVSEYVHGTKGSADVSGAKILDASGKTVYSFGRGGGDGHQQEHHDLFADLRAGRRPFEGDWGALSTMTAIYGRMCTYSGQQLSWDEALNSNVVISPVEKYKSLQDEPPVKPDADGMYARPVPGVTKVV